MATSPATQQAPQAPLPVGKNVTARVEGDELVVRMKMGVTLGRSKSNKNDLIATTNGFVTVTSDGLRLSLNLIK